MKITKSSRIAVDFKKIISAAFIAGLMVASGYLPGSQPTTAAANPSAHFANLPPQRDDEVDPNYGQEGSSGTNPNTGVQTSILPNNWDTIDLLTGAIWIMTAGVGVAAVGGIVWGAVLYTTAGGSQEKTKKGIEIIRNVVIGLLLYVFMFAIINFLIPGRVIT